MKILFVVLVMFVAMNASGQWQPDVRLTNNPAWSSTSYNNAWCIASIGKFVHVVWSDERDGYYEIYYKRSTDAGISWGVDVRLTNNTSYSDFPSVAVTDSVVHVEWYEGSGDNWKIHHKRSTDAGISWGEEVRMTNETTLTMLPFFAVSGSDVHVVWWDNRNGNTEIYYKRSTDAGISWGADVRLTNNTGDSYYPSAAVSGSDVHVVWTDKRNGNTEIYYKHSTDAGISWGADVRLTNNTGDSKNPSVAVSGSVVHVVWRDNRDGNTEIYYKRDPTGNTTGISNISTDIYLDKFEDAQKAYNKGNYLLVIDLLKDFPIDNVKYNEAVALMKQALEKLPRNSNQSFVTVSGRINCGCKKTINGYVVFEDINTRLNVGRCAITSDGYYCIVLPTGKTYSYYIDSKDFYPLSRVIDFTSSNQTLNHKDNITIVSYEEMKEQQVSVRINNIFFDFNESKLKSESYLELDRMYNFLKDNPEIKVEISGYTDNVGTDEYNQNLSLSRAKTVKDYLVDKGIYSVRITSKGYGKSNPVATNDTDEGRQLNRRVEFTILKKHF